VKYVCGAAHFSQSASTLQSGDTGLTEIWQRVIKEKQEKFIDPALLGVSKQRAGCMIFSSSGTSSDSTKIEEVIF